MTLVNETLSIVMTIVNETIGTIMTLANYDCCYDPRKE